MAIVAQMEPLISFDKNVRHPWDPAGRRRPPTVPADGPLADDNEGGDLSGGRPGAGGGGQGSRGRRHDGTERWREWWEPAAAKELEHPAGYWPAELLALSRELDGLEPPFRSRRVVYVQSCGSVVANVPVGSRLRTSTPHLLAIAGRCQATGLPSRRTARRPTRCHRRDCSARRSRHRRLAAPSRGAASPPLRPARQPPDRARPAS